MVRHILKLVTLAFSIGISAANIANEQYPAICQSYYPMMGEVAVSEKEENDKGYYVTIVELAGWARLQGPTASMYSLTCDETTYRSIQIGDVINCSRVQSVMTRQGELIEIKSNLGHISHHPNYEIYSNYITPQAESQDISD